MKRLLRKYYFLLSQILIQVFIKSKTYLDKFISKIVLSIEDNHLQELLYGKIKSKVYLDILDGKIKLKAFFALVSNSLLSIYENTLKVKALVLLKSKLFLNTIKGIIVSKNILSFTNFNFLSISKFFLKIKQLIFLKGNLHLSIAEKNILKIFIKAKIEYKNKLENISSFNRQIFNITKIKFQNLIKTSNNKVLNFNYKLINFLQQVQPNFNKNIDIKGEKSINLNSYLSLKNNNISINTNKILIFIKKITLASKNQKKNKSLQKVNAIWSVFTTVKKIIKIKSKNGLNFIPRVKNIIAVFLDKKISIIRTNFIEKLSLITNLNIKTKILNKIYSIHYIKLKIESQALTSFKKLVYIYQAVIHIFFSSKKNIVKLSQNFKYKLILTKARVQDIAKTVLSLKYKLILDKARVQSIAKTILFLKYNIYLKNLLQDINFKIKQTALNFKINISIFIHKVEIIKNNIIFQYLKSQISIFIFKIDQKLKIKYSSQLFSFAKIELTKSKFSNLVQNILSFKSLTYIKSIFESSLFLKLNLNFESRLNLILKFDEFITKQISKVKSLIDIFMVNSDNKVLNITNFNSKISLSIWKYPELIDNGLIITQANTIIEENGELTII